MTWGVESKRPIMQKKRLRAFDSNGNCQLTTGDSMASLLLSVRQPMQKKRSESKVMRAVAIQCVSRDTATDSKDWLPYNHHTIIG